MKLTKHKLSIISLALIFLIALTAFFGLHFRKADASGTVTVSGSNVFTSSGVGATVSSYQKGEGSDAEYYTMFSIVDGEQTVSYRKNLAYSWYEGVTEGEGEEAVTVPRHGYFNMKIGFANTSFEKFVITFESQVYNKIKENKSLNYLMFFPAEEGKVLVLATDDAEAQAKDIKDNEKTILDTDEINIEFTGRDDDAYLVSVYSDLNRRYEGRFENVGGNFAKSSTSSTNPVYPLIFGAEFAEEEEKEGSKAEMVLYSINGQSFKVSSSTSLTVADDKPPVLCLEEDIRYFAPGSALDIDYTVIDVLRGSPSSTVNYYVLTYSDKKEGVKDFEYKEPEDEYRLDSDENVYLPEADDLKGTVFNAYNEQGKFTADMLVSVYIKLSDISSNSETCDVYLDWYVEESTDEKYLVKVNGKNFIAVASDKEGVSYAYSDWGQPEATPLYEEYQKKVDEAAKNLSAGSSSYIYLPSPEKLFKDSGTSYRDMKFSIYYYHDSQSSSTNLSANSLSLNVSRQGSYLFTFYATDKAGNKMVAGGEEFGSDEIWDMFKDGDSRLPWFRFDVGYTGVSFEETPGMQATAYVGTAYSGASFKINGVTDSYDTVYRLFRFDSARYYKENNKSFTYEEFMKNMDGLFNDAQTRKYFYEILPVNELEETDEEYEEFADYQWSSTYTSFTPQVAGLYYMRAEVTDKLYNSEPVTCSLAVVASEKATPIKGESDWLKNNIASVVLLGVAGLALIGIILLLVIKPKDKGDIDVQFEEKKKKNKK